MKVLEAHGLYLDRREAETVAKERCAEHRAGRGEPATVVALTHVNTVVAFLVLDTKTVQAIPN